VTDIDAVAHLASSEIGIHSTGGMITKLQAAKMAFQSGIATVIASGLEPGVLAAAVAGKSIGTQFPVNK
jgi:glutamate 5-kinase